MRRRLWTGAARAFVLAFCWTTALYAFIASSAFAYLQFIKPRVFWWVGALSDSHAALSWIWLALLVVTLRDDLGRGSRAARPARLLAGVAGAGVIANSVRPVLPSLHEGSASIVAALAALLPVLLLALVDHVHAWSHLRSQNPTSGEVQQAAEGRVFTAAVASAFLVTLAYVLLATVAISGAFEPDLDSAALAVGAASSLLHHLLVFCAAFAGLAVALRFAGASVTRQDVIVLAGASALFAFVFSAIAGRAIGLTGSWGFVAAAFSGASIACAWGGYRLRQLAARGSNMTTGLDGFFAGAPAHRTDVRTTMAVGAVLPAAWLLAFTAGRIDWDFALLRTGVVTVWVFAFAAVFRAVPLRDVPTWMMFAVGAAPLALNAWWQPEITDGHALERYAVYNPSFRLADGMLRGSVESSTFDAFLRENTGLTDRTLEPRSIDFVPPSALAPKENPPHVFLLVIDSLRADYLSPYNTQVQFTPRIDAFARDNVAFRNAFTVYGGTGMSMPAIWAGSVLAHKQYVLPFEPMNALEKLLAVNNYQRMMTGGFINETLWTKQPGDVQLQAGVDEMQFEFCATVDEIGQHLEQRTAGAPPVFVQTLPQDLHVAKIRETVVPPDRSYGGLDAPYAYRVERIDSCFGAFIDRLQRLGLYDNSVVILTADHGDLLGEDGQWGHSYQLFPDIVQVPLLMHLPRDVELAVDSDDPVFSVDITPTIYASLGYAPTPEGPLAGRPLGRRGGAGATGEGEASVGEPGYRVIAASYGAVYAVVSREGRELYIADAVKGEAHVYRRESPTDVRWSKVPVDEGTRVLAELRIRRHIDAIADAWGIDARF